MKFKVGDYVLYKKGEEHYEIGKIKGFNRDGKPFVWYNTGDTASCTPLRCLKPIYNMYAIEEIIKKQA